MTPVTKNGHIITSAHVLWRKAAVSTYDASAFSDRVGQDGDRDILFNGPGDGPNHGHVVMDPQDEYKYVRDVEGNEYINR